MSFRRGILVLFVILSLQPATLAQDQVETPGFRAEFLGMFDLEAGKVLKLAETVPQDNYGWRPAEGVRSVSEVYMHTAGGNLMFASMIKGEEVDFSALMAREKELTKKEDVTRELALSIEKVKSLVKGMSDADLEKSVTIPFIPLTTTARGVLMIVMSHVSEHLGQSIAYARMNNITPPWTAAQSGGNE